MQLSSALELKNEIRAFLDQAIVRGRRRPNVAFGITAERDGGRHRIAIRARRKADLEHEVVRFVHARAAGEVDERVTGPIEAGPALAPGVAPKGLSIGSSVAHYCCTAGTLGFFARRTRDGAIGIVSNNHVLAACDDGNDADDILNPAPSDRGRRPKDVIARLAGDYPRLRRETLPIDCAFAPLTSPINFDPRSLGGNERLDAAAAPPRQIAVGKVGRTTGRTAGKISVFALDNVDVDYSFGTLLFNGQLEIESKDEMPFSSRGDSGSLVFSDSLHPVALLFANCPIGGSRGSGLTYAHPIGAVLEALAVTIVA